jgi:hypothetical protein
MGRATVATTQQAAIKKIPGIATDGMRDYDLAALGYQETEFSIEGRATSYALLGEAARARCLLHPDQGQPSCVEGPPTNLKPGRRSRD